MPCMHKYLSRLEEPSTCSHLTALRMVLQEKALRTQKEGGKIKYPLRRKVSLNRLDLS